MFYAGMLAGAAYGGLMSDQGGIKGALKGAAIGGLAGRYGGRALARGMSPKMAGKGFMASAKAGTASAYKLAAHDVSWLRRSAIGGSRGSKSATKVASNSPMRGAGGRFVSPSASNVQRRLAGPAAAAMGGGVGGFGATMGGLKSAWNATRRGVR